MLQSNTTFRVSSGLTAEMLNEVEKKTSDEDSCKYSDSTAASTACE